VLYIVKKSIQDIMNEFIVVKNLGIQQNVGTEFFSVTLNSTHTIQREFSVYLHHDELRKHCPQKEWKKLLGVWKDNILAICSNYILSLTLTYIIRFFVTKNALHIDTLFVCVCTEYRGEKEDFYACVQIMPEMRLILTREREGERERSGVKSSVKLAVLI
jgi:hypothetical protein